MTLCIALAGCGHVAHLTNLQESTCKESLTSGFQSILERGDEDPTTAAAFATTATANLAKGEIGSEDFYIRSTSRRWFRFFIDDTDQGCLLRLHKKGWPGVRIGMGVRPFLDSSPLRGCTCAQ